MRRFRTANGSDRIIRQLGKQLTPRILMRAVEVPVVTAILKRLSSKQAPRHCALTLTPKVIVIN